MKCIHILKPDPHPGNSVSTGALLVTLLAFAIGASACASSEPICQSSVELHEGGVAFIDPTEPFPMFVELYDGQQRELVARVSIMRDRESLLATWDFAGNPDNGTARTVDFPVIRNTLYVAASAPYHNAAEGPYSYGIVTIVTGMVEDEVEGQIENSWLVLVHKDEHAQVIDLGFGTNAYAIAPSKDRKDVQLVEVNRTGSVPAVLTAEFLSDDEIVSDGEGVQKSAMLVASTAVNNIEFLAVDVHQFDNNTGDGGAEFGMILQDKAQSNWHDVSISDECLAESLPLQ